MTQAETSHSLQEGLKVGKNQDALRVPDQSNLAFLTSFIGEEAVTFLQSHSQIFYRESKTARWETLRVFYCQVFGRVMELIQKENNPAGRQNEIEIHFSLIDDFLANAPEMYFTQPTDSAESQQFMIFFKQLLGVIKKDCRLKLKASDLRRKKIIEHIVAKSGLTQVVIENLTT